LDFHHQICILFPLGGCLDRGVHLKQARKSSANDFNACKAAVAKAVGYPESLLSGDGELIQEAGYKSFMLKGPGKDLFFCEVHPGSRYKVSAALNGNFPFKYIAEGKF